jgi:hypothetical protein
VVGCAGLLLFSGRREGRSGTGRSGARGSVATAERQAAEAALREALASENYNRLAAAVDAAEEPVGDKLLIKKARATLQALKRRRLAGMEAKRGHVHASAVQPRRPLAPKSPSSASPSEEASCGNIDSASLRSDDVSQSLEGFEVARRKGRPMGKPRELSTLPPSPASSSSSPLPSPWDLPGVQLQRTTSHETGVSFPPLLRSSFFGSYLLP